MIQQVKNKEWIDHLGRKVPIEYVDQSDRIRERYAAKLFNDAAQINKKLELFKAEVKKICGEMLEKKLTSYNEKKRDIYKGNDTWYNFDHSIMIKVNISSRDTFDPVGVDVCKSKLNEFINENLDSKTAFLKGFVMEAFSTSRGQLDSKKVMSLTEYRTKILHPLFQEALNILEKSRTSVFSATYFQISLRKEDGSYVPIDLNFSSI